MPASIAWATGAGMPAMSAPSWGTSPVSTISMPVTRKAPTAAGHPPSTVPVATNSAAPGVDQATVIGIRVHRESRMHDRPIVTLTASSPLAACPGSAPTAARPLRTTAKELVKPTSADTTPAEIGRSCSMEPDFCASRGDSERELIGRHCCMRAAAARQPWCTGGHAMFTINAQPQDCRAVIRGIPPARQH